MVELNFNAAEVPDASFELVPPGWYVAAIEEVEQKDNTNGSGWRLNLKVKIDESVHPQVGNRVIFASLAMEHNTSPRAVAIGKSQLKKICTAVGKPDGVRDSDELLYRQIAVKVKIVPETPQYAAKNNIMDYDAAANRREEVAATNAALASPAGKASSDPFPAQSSQQSAAQHGGVPPGEKPW